MATKLASIKPKEMLRLLQKGGFYVHETSGSHVHLKHPDKPGRITVPCHTRFDLPKHIVKSIIRQAGFFALLKQ